MKYWPELLILICICTVFYCAAVEAEDENSNNWTSFGAVQSDVNWTNTQAIRNDVNWQTNGE